MSSTGKIQYGSNNQSISISLNGLGGTSSRCSAAIDNSVNLFLDALVCVNLNSGSSANGYEDGQVLIYAYGTSDGGSTYTDGMPGTDSAVTPTDPSNLKLIGQLNSETSGQKKAGPFSVARAFGGILPEKWGIVVRNNAGNALGGPTNSAWYQGIYGQVV